VILLVPGARVELARGMAPRDFKSTSVIQEIFHHFQVLIYQVLTRVKLGYVGLCWVIFGFDGYNIVTVPQAYDEVFLYVPTDPHDTLNLGGEAVIYLGEEAYNFTKPTAIFMPGGVPHNPNYYKRVERPFYMIVLAVTYNAKFHDSEFTPSPTPKAWKF
jgi:hypothetical protein